MVNSSSSSGIFFQGDDQTQTLRNSHLTSYGNSNLVPRNMYSNTLPVSHEVSNASSGPSVGASSLVTDANSGLSGNTPCLQRSASINNESYLRFPASPLSFSSNNISISGSSVLDGPSTATSLPNPRNQIPFAESSIFRGSLIQDQENISHLQKKPRLDNIKHDDLFQQQVLRQMLQRQESMRLQSQNPNPNTNAQLQALYQQQQLLQSLPPIQRAQFLQQQRQNYQQPYDGGVCSRRLMQYLYHQRQRPADISYWRKFVAEYYSPRAKQRWCLSLHNNVGHHPLGVFPPANTDIWQCGVCGSKSGRGFDATFEVLARLNEIKFSSGVIDELWFLDLPRESRLPSGVMVLEYAKAVQESVYEQLRVVHEGRLKIVFAPDLKILTWEFCSRRHEELLPRRLVAPQVNNLLEVTQKWQSAIAESASGGVSQQDLQTNGNMVVTAGRQLAKSLELQSLNDLGFTKRYVRCLQIAEVVNSLKDVMDFSQENKVGPIEALKSYPRKTNVAKLQMQKMQGMEQMSSMHGLPVDRNALNNNFHMGSRGSPLSDYQNMLMRQASMNSNPQQSIPFRGQPVQNIPYQRFPSNGIFQGQQNYNHQQPSSSQGGGGGGGQQAIQQHHMIQQVLKGMKSNDNNGGGSGGAKPSISGQSGGPTRSNSFKAGSHSDSCAPDLPHVSEVFQDIASELTDSEYFNNEETEVGMSYAWKA